MVSGDLSVFPLLPVMQMLLASGRSGQFMVDHPRGGTLWFENGEIIHARSGELRGEAALQLMSSLDGGVFSFEPNRSPPERTLHLKQDAAMHRMLMDSDAWAVLLRLFPNWSRPVRFTSRWTEQQPVTRQQYLALNLITLGLPLRQMFEHSTLPPRTILETLRPFLANGLIEVE